MLQTLQGCFQAQAVLDGSDFLSIVLSVPSLRQTDKSVRTATIVADKDHLPHELRECAP